MFHARCIGAILVALVSQCVVVRAFAVTSTTRSITISWSEKPASYDGGNFTVYVDDEARHTQASWTSAGAYEIANLTAGTSYDVAVRGLNASAITLLFQLQKATKPLSPNVAVVPVSETQLALTWDMVEGYTYTVRYKVSGAAAGELTATGCSVSGCSITVSGSVPGSMYTVSVVAISNTEESSPAVGSSNTKPKAPTGVVVSAVSTSQFKVVWTAATDSTQEADNYVVTYKVANSAGDAVSAKECKSSPCNVTTSGNPAGSRYSVSVKATSGNAQSDVTTQQGNTQPKAPTGVVVSAVSTSQFKVVWTAATDSTQEADNYVVTYKVANSAGDAVTAKECKSSPCSVTTSGNPAGSRYSVSVKATSGNAQSDVTTQQGNTQPKAPTGVVVSAVSTSQFKVVWTAATDSTQEADNYVVTYKVANSAGDAVTAEECKSSPCSVTTSGDPAGSRYSVSVKATSGNAQSDVTTQQGNTRPEAPTITKASAVDESALKLEWVAHTNSFQTGYKVSYKTDAAAAGTPVAGCTQSPCQFTPAGSVPGTRYSIALSATAGSEESALATTYVNTRPPRPLAVNRGDPATTTTLSVMWKVPAIGNFDKYAVTVKRKSDPNAVLQTKTVTKASGTLSAEFTGLSRPGAEYETSVRTQVGSEVSEPASATFRIKPLSATGLVTSGDSVSQLAIGWNAPVESDYTSFTVKLAEVSSSERSVTYDTRTATFDQLLAGGRFTAVVTTVSGDQVAKDLTAIFYTKPLSVSGALTVSAVGSHTLTVSWEYAASNEFDGFQVWLAGGSTANVAKDQRSHKFGSLAPATAYTISVRVKAASKYSETTTTTAITRPTQPMSLEATEVTTSSLSLRWTAPPAAVDYYYTYHVSRADVDTSYNASGTTAVVTGLVAGATYRVTVTAVFRDVNSEPSIAITPTLRPTNVIDLEAINMAKTSIEIRWKAPDGDYSEFLVKVTDMQGAAVSSQQVASSVLRQELGSLSTGTKYRITMYTISSDQQSDGLTISAITQLPNITSFEVLVLTSNSIKVKWEAPSGTFLRYELAIDPNDGNEKHPIKVVSGATPLEYEFSELRAGRTYSCSIKVVSDDRISAAKVRQITTKPLPVTALTAETLGTNQLKVSWTSSDTSYQDLFQIQISYKIKSDSTSQKETVLPVKDQYKYETLLNSLSPGNTYVLSVFASSNGVNSEMQTVERTTKPLAVVDLSVEVSSSSEVQVSWLAGSGGRQDGYRMRRRAERQGVGWSEWIQRDDEVTTSTQGGLLAGYTYSFAVVAYSADVTSDVATETATVFPLPPKELVVDAVAATTSSFTLRWTADASFRTGWRVVYAKSGVSTSAAKTIALTPSEVKVDGLKSGQTYTVKMFGLSTGVASQEPASARATVKPVISTELTELTDETTTTTVAVAYSKPPLDDVFDSYMFSVNDNDGQRVTKQRSEPDRKVKFGGLTPGTTYIVDAVTQSRAQSSSKKVISITTVPQQVRASCFTPQPHQIELQLDRVQGPLDRFEVTCYTCGGATNLSLVTVVDPGKTYIRTYSNLQPYTKYVFHVRAVRKEKYSVSVAAECQTNEGAPDAVRDFTAYNVTYNRLQLSWQRPAVTNGVLNKYTLSYSGKLKGQTEHTGTEITVDNNMTEDFHTIAVTDLKAGFTYVFTIYAHTALLQGKRGTAGATTPTRAPHVVTDRAASRPKVLPGTVTGATFAIRLVNPFSDLYGVVNSYSLIVTTNPSDAGDIGAGGDDEVATWASAQRDSNIVTYVAIDRCERLFQRGNGCWEGRARRAVGRGRRAMPGEAVSVTVGADGSCDVTATANVCNGALASGTDYYVKLRAYTASGFTDTPFSQPIHTTDASGLVVWQIAVIAIVAAIVLIIVIVVFIICIRKHSGKKMADSAPDEVIHMRGNRSRREVKSKPVKLVEFEAHFSEMMADSEYRFGEEFEDLNPVGREQAMIAASLPANQSKNRFINILPYDSTRVKLVTAADAPEGADYINGNWLQGFSRQREYMVMQGPLSATINDFWRSIWDYDVRTIVMLTNTMEKGKEKCSTYWPQDNDPIVYAGIKVEVFKVTTDAEWVITDMKLSKGGKTLLVKHYHLLTWLDWQAPPDFRSIISFVQLVRGQVSRKDNSAMMVHCSAGVGRSGTFIAIDWLLQHIKEHDYIDIYGIVYNMRKQRIYMVQAERQYIFIHKCMLNVLKHGGLENPAYEGDSSLTTKTAL